MGFPGSCSHANGTPMRPKGVAGEFKGEPGNTRELEEQEEKEEEDEDKDRREEMLFFAGKLAGSDRLATNLLFEESIR